MKKQPLLICFASFFLGIFFQDELKLPFFNLLTMLIVAIIGVSAIFFLKFGWIQKIKVLFVISFFFCLGTYLHFNNSKQFQLPTFSKNDKIVFTLDKKLNSNENNKRYVVHLMTKNGDFLSVLSVPKALPELDFKNIYRAQLWVQVPESPNNDFQFNYQKYLLRQHIYFQSYLPKSFEFATKKNIGFSEAVKQNRLVLLHRIDETEMSKSSQNFLKGIILSDRTEMDQQMVTDFNVSGLVHFLAISGTHIVIIYWLINLILVKLIPLKYRKFSIVLSLLLIWCFAIYIGFGSSVVRSCIMISVYYIYVLLQRKPDLLHSLSLAGLLILFYDTQQLFDIGFQLSFIAVFGIFWLNNAILKFFPKTNNKVKDFFQNIISVSLSAQLFTLPLVLFYFHQYSWISIFANLVIIPFSEIIIVSSFLMTLFLKFNFEFVVANRIYDFVVLSLLKVIHWFAEMDFAFYKMIPMSIYEMLTLFIILIVLRVVLIRFSLKILSLFIGLVLLFITLRIFLNINEGSKDETLLVKNFKENVLINKKGQQVYFFLRDDKKKNEIIKNVVEPYLTSRRIEKYKMIVAKDKVVVIDKKKFVLSE